MKLLQLLFTCLCCCFSCVVFSQDKKEKETITIDGSADTSLTPDCYDLYTMKVVDDHNETGMNVQDQLIKQLLNKSGIDTSRVILTSVTNNDYRQTKRADKERYNVIINIRTFDVANIITIKKKLGDSDYRVLRCIGQLSDSLFDKQAISKLLLARAIRNGKQKANEVAAELGMRSVEFVSFREGELKEDRSESSAYGMGGGDGSDKIKLTKRVTLVYRPGGNKK